MMAYFLLFFSTFAAAAAAGLLLLHMLHRAELRRAREQSEEMLSEAQKRRALIIKEAQIQSKERIIQKRQQLQKDVVAAKDRIRESRKVLDDREDLSDREKNLAQREQASRAQKERLDARWRMLADKADTLAKLKTENRAKLHQMADIRSNEGRPLVMQRVSRELHHEMSSFVQRYSDRFYEERERRAKALVALTFQRAKPNKWAAALQYTLDLQSEDVKKRIMGPDGSLLRLFEELTRTEVNFDNFPGTIAFHAPDGVQREIAKRAMQKIISKRVTDKVQVKESVDKAKREVDRFVFEEATQVLRELAIRRLDKEIVKLLGRLRFRTSYGQNILYHSREVAHLAAVLAGELGYNVKTAKRSALLHDIGKAIDHHALGSHAELGAKLLQQHGESPVIVNAVWAHHDEVEKESIYPELVKAADAISGARPGARRETLEHYIARIKKLESIAVGCDGVTKCYAIQAGRELRVMVDPRKINDARAAEMCKSIAGEIEDHCTFPGEIKVTLIRETKVTNSTK